MVTADGLVDGPSTPKSINNKRPHSGGFAAYKAETRSSPNWRLLIGQRARPEPHLLLWE
jgi:hypothetical protein